MIDWEGVDDEFWFEWLIEEEFSRWIFILMIDWGVWTNEFWFEWLIEEMWMMDFDLNDWLERCGWWIKMWMIDWGGVDDGSWFEWLIREEDECILISMIDWGVWTNEFWLNEFWFQWLIGEYERWILIWMIDLGVWTNKFWFEWLIEEVWMMNFVLMI